MDPYELEELVAKLWDAKGYRTTVRKGSGDRGVDVIAEKSDPFNRKQLIQVKRYSDSNSIGSQAVRIYATLYEQNPDSDIVAIVTTGGFTTQAVELASDLKVRIMNGDNLSQHLKDDLGVDQLCEILSLNESNPVSSKNEIPVEDRVECPYCEAVFREETSVRRHLFEEHDQSEFRAIDKRRVDRYMKNNGLDESM